MGDNKNLRDYLPTYRQIDIKDLQTPEVRREAERLQRQAWEQQRSQMRSAKRSFFSNLRNFNTNKDVHASGNDSPSNNNNEVASLSIHEEGDDRTPSSAANPALASASSTTSSPDGVNAGLVPQIETVPIAVTEDLINEDGEVIDRPFSTIFRTIDKQQYQQQQQHKKAGSLITALSLDHISDDPQIVSEIKELLGISDEIFPEEDTADENGDDDEDDGDDGTTLQDDTEDDVDEDDADFDVSAVLKAIGKQGQIESKNSLSSDTKSSATKLDPLDSPLATSLPTPKNNQVDLDSRAFNDEEEQGEKDTDSANAQDDTSDASKQSAAAAATASKSADLKASLSGASSDETEEQSLSMTQDKRLVPLTSALDRKHKDIPLIFNSISKKDDKKKMTWEEVRAKIFESITPA